MNKSARKKGKTKTCRTRELSTYKETAETCRACLGEGRLPINKSESCNLMLAVRTFGDVEIDEDDPFPKYLCEACHTLLQNAIQFRETVKQSDKLLRQKVKKEDEDSSDNIIDNFSDNQDLDTIAETIWDKHAEVKSEDKPKNYLVHQQNTKFKIKKTNVKVQCDICKKSISKYYYKDHLALHGLGTPKQKVKTDCNICNKSMEKSYFKQHMSTVHGNEQSKYVCFICGKVFRFQSGYKSHILSHSNEFPFKCQHCPYRGRHSGLLKTHMRVHERDYKFQCSHCAAQFLTSGNLNKHMLKHKEKKFKCDACTRAFHTKTDVEQHFQVDHLGIKSHICTVCDKAFGYRKAMMKHISKIHKKAKQQCGRLPSYLTVQMDGTKETDIEIV